MKETLYFDTMAYFWNEDNPTSATVSKLHMILETKEQKLYFSKSGITYKYCSHCNPLISQDDTDDLRDQLRGELSLPF